MDNRRSSNVITFRSPNIVGQLKMSTQDDRSSICCCDVRRNFCEKWLPKIFDLPPRDLMMVSGNNTHTLPAGVLLPASATSCVHFLHHTLLVTVHCLPYTPLRLNCSAHGRPSWLHSSSFLTVPSLVDGSQFFDNRILNKTHQVRMGKKKAAKRKAMAAFSSNVTPVVSVNTDDTKLTEVVCEDEIVLASETLETLSKNPSVLRSKTLKRLKAAVYDFQRIAAANSGTGSSLTSRVSNALTDGRWTDALVLLSEMRIRGDSPKLGALQRWVRDCDAASGTDGSFKAPEVMRVLDSILRTTTPEIIDHAASTTGDGPVNRHDPWFITPNGPLPLYHLALSNKLFGAAEKKKLASKFKIVSETPGPQRKPPNLHPAIIYSSTPGTIQMNPKSKPVQRHEVPHVQGAFLLTNVLTPEECKQIVACGEAVEFIPDQASGGSATELESVLAHNFYWLADTPFLETMYHRVKKCLPQQIHGGEVMGINARFRVYRYVPGAVYRPHIDGAWPPSGLDAEGRYVYDTSSPDAPIWSRLTFLVYLNDEFDQGCTTFFVPSTQVGTMDARPVKPRQGCALVFPHGDTHGSLLHEGSPVGAGGGKYVLYRVQKGDVVLEKGDQADADVIVSDVSGIKRSKKDADR
ncbi:hypothetical protein PROFUN_13033 [Planoprotostelium fungivorum]|uniref:Fe2OG dioxygenase domain-containing protein n=1 Tax=Planoprotostelium fungivorum TaxID=1890364 RepID=A0A2P6N5L1_9EUKA|nr:hypothetical protein PROFUN_13033 [Planoprotostelium fungivorum]